MTQQQIQDLLNKIKQYTDQYGPVLAGIAGPQVTVGFIIGKAVIDVAPSLEGIVSNMIAGTAPTPEQNAAANSELAVLGNPEGL